MACTLPVAVRGSALKEEGEEEGGDEEEEEKERNLKCCCQLTTAALVCDAHNRGLRASHPGTEPWTYGSSKTAAAQLLHVRSGGNERACV